MPNGKSIKAVAAVMDLPFGRQILLSISYWPHFWNIFKTYGNNLVMMQNTWKMVAFDLDENDVEKNKIK